MVDIKQKASRKTLEEEIAYYEKDFDEYVLIIGTNFSKVKKKLILGGLHC